jgi:purine-binding chemotaxis protein CheW
MILGKIMQDEIKVDKFIVFKIADYLLGLPIGNVLKVVNCPYTENNRLRTLGVVQLGHHMIRVLDFYQPLSPSDLPQLLNELSFLVITRDAEGELCGILVDEPPNLVELPPEMIRSLPKSDRHFSMFKMVSHAAFISHKEATTTIFLLDIKQSFRTQLLQS